jgi:hypothetical protein
LLVKQKIQQEEKEKMLVLRQMAEKLNETNEPKRKKAKSQRMAVSVDRTTYLQGNIIN